jgi:hypothetical protein
MMKQCGWALAFLVAVPLLNAPARAQTPLDALEKDLDEVKQQHQQMTAANFDNFLNELNAAAGDPQQAAQLYQAAGGKLPNATAVKTEHEHETPDEKSARLEKDREKMARFESMLQLHCGMMRLAALFVEKPDTATLQGDWVAWLKSAAPTYEQLDGPEDIKNLKMDKSVIGAYLNFDDWGDKEQGKWSVSDLPKFFRSQVLEPLRTPPTAATLPVWDTYIAMKSIDEPDQDKWTGVEYPALLFEKDSDDFASAPSTEKLQTLVELIKANAKHPKVDDWIAQVHDMMKSYRSQIGATAVAGGAPAASAPSDFVQPDNPNAAPAVAQTVTNAAPAADAATNAAPDGSSPAAEPPPAK